MSRCFPYPPPGFEPPIDLLNKEKRKDKKHKKDKREKEKREGKDGKEKHRDKDRKDKKDKKEKHKHKKKDKDKEREKDREKSKEKEKEKIRSTEKTLEDSRLIDELAKRVGDGSQPTSQFTERREKKPIPVPVPVPNSAPSVQKRNDELARVGPTSQKPNHHVTDFAERREKKSVPVPVPNSVPQRKSDELARQGPTNQTNNHRVTTNFTERRAGQVSQEEGPNSKRTIQNSPNPNSRNSNFTNHANASNPNSKSPNFTNHVNASNPNSKSPNFTNHANASNPNSKSPNLSLQRKSNGPATQINSNHQHSAGFSERKVVPSEMKKPIPVPVPVPNSSQTKTNGTTSQKFATNHVVPQTERKIEGPTRQIGTNNHLTGEKREREKVEREKGGLNLRGSEQMEGKKEKKEKRKETSEERELRREEKKRKKKEEKRQRKKEEKEKQREKVKEANLINKTCLEGPQRNIEKVGGGFGEVSNKRKEVESNGFLHEDEMRAQKLLKTEPPQKRKDELTNGFVHENDAGPAKLNKKLPLYPPPQNGKTTNTLHSSHTPSPIKPHITTINNNTPSNSKITKNALHTQINSNTTKLEVPQAVNKTPQISNGTVSDAKGDLVNSKKGKDDSSKHSKRKEREESKESKPHRDLKYLNVVYSVPKLKEEDLLPQDDEEEWLFGTKPNPNSKNPNPNSKRVDESSEVWDRAVRIDSVDLIALPYVIPF